jgi:hypothetical protein
MDRVTAMAGATGRACSEGLQRHDLGRHRSSRLAPASLYKAHPERRVKKTPEQGPGRLGPAFSGSRYLSWPPCRPPLRHAGAARHRDSYLSAEHCGDGRDTPSTLRRAASSCRRSEGTCNDGLPISRSWFDVGAVPDFRGLQRSISLHDPLRFWCGELQCFD